MFKIFNYPVSLTCSNSENNCGISLVTYIIENCYIFLLSDNLNAKVRTCQMTVSINMHTFSIIIIYHNFYDYVGNQKIKLEYIYKIQHAVFNDDQDFTDKNKKTIKSNYSSYTTIVRLILPFSLYIVCNFYPQD